MIDLAVRLPQDTVTSFAKPRCPVVESMAEGLVAFDPISQTLVFGHDEPVWGKFDPEVAWQRHHRPEIKGLRPPGRMRRARADVRPHHFKRHEVKKPPLDRDPADGIDIVASPEPIGARGEPGVDPPASRRARFHLDLRERRAKLIP